MKLRRIHSPTSQYGFSKVASTILPVTCRSAHLAYAFLVIGTIGLVCILTATMLSLEYSPTLAQSSKKERSSSRKDKEKWRSFKFTDSALTINASGFPPGKPTHNLNGFRVNLPVNGSMTLINKHCSQKAECYPAPNLLRLKASNPPCSSFKEIFDEFRECEEKRKAKIRGWGRCTSLFLDNGFWRNVYKIDYQERTLVVKVAKGKHIGQTSNLLRHHREATLLQHLKGNPYLVNYEGHCLNKDTNEFALITLFYQRGNLKQFVESGKLSELSVGELLDWSTELARGVQAIHEVAGGPFVHADLQLRQVMIADDYTLKLNDFNRGKWLFKDKDNESCGYCGSKSKGKWRAPEEYQRTLLTEKLDIYTLGIMLNCLWNNVNEPFHEYAKEEVYDIVPEGFRPNLPVHAPEGIQKVIKSCWYGDPEKRPSARSVANEIMNIKENLPSGELSRPFIDCEYELIEKPHKHKIKKRRKIHHKKNTSW